MTIKSGLNPLVEQFKLNQSKRQDREQPKKVTVINWSEEIILHIRPIGFFDSVRNAARIAGDDNSSGDDRVAWQMLENIGSCVTEFDNITEDDLKAAGVSSMAEFVNGFFDDTCKGQLYNLISEHTRKVRNAKDQEVSELAAEIKN